MAEPLVWIDGSLVPADEATVAATDRGVLLGDGVFETIRAVDGAPIAISRHLDRLHRSAAQVGITVAHHDRELRRAVAAVLGALDEPLARVRITVTAGVGPLGPARTGGAPTTIVVAGPMAPAEETTAVCTARWVRNERSPLAGVKSTSHGEAVVVLEHARALGCSEALLADTMGRLSEGTGSNVFVVLDGRLLTPARSAGCLDGVTRALVLELTEAEEADIPMSELARASELFLTSTGRGVQAVHRLDDRDLPAPGPATMAARRALDDHLAAHPDP